MDSATVARLWSSEINGWHAFRLASLSFGLISMRMSTIKSWYQSFRDSDESSRTQNRLKLRSYDCLKLSFPSGHLLRDFSGGGNRESAMRDTERVVSCLRDLMALVTTVTPYSAA